MTNNILDNDFKNKDLHPLSINISKLQKYDFTKFSIDEILLFEYLILYSSFCGFKEFYRSNSNILRDINLKRSRLEKAKKKFIKLGFLKIEIKGLPAVTYYFIDYNILITKLDSIYKPEYIKEIISNLKEFYKNKKTKKVNENTNTYKTLDNLKIDYLNNTPLVNEICKIKRIDLSRLKSYLTTFINNLKTQDQTAKSQKEFNKYFGNWLNKEMKENPLPPYLKSLKRIS